MYFESGKIYGKLKTLIPGRIQSRTHGINNQKSDQPIMRDGHTYERYIHTWVFSKNMGTPPNHPFKLGFYYNPSFLGTPIYPYCWKHPHNGHQSPIASGLDLRRQQPGLLIEYSIYRLYRYSIYHFFVVAGAII